MNVSPVVKKDILIGGGVLLSAIMVARFVHHPPTTGTTIPSYGNMSLGGGNLSSPASVTPTLGALGDYPTTPPTGSNPTPAGVEPKTGGYTPPAHDYFNIPKDPNQSPPSRGGGTSCITLADGTQVCTTPTTHPGGR